MAVSHIERLVADGDGGGPGFGACERWLGCDERTVSVATYDLTAIDVLRGPAYQDIAYDNLTAWSKRVTGMCRRILRVEGVQVSPGAMAAPERADGLEPPRGGGDGLWQKTKPAATAPSSRRCCPEHSPRPRRSSHCRRNRSRE